MANSKLTGLQGGEEERGEGEMKDKLGERKGWEGNAAGREIFRGEGAWEALYCYLRNRKHVLCVSIKL